MRRIYAGIGSRKTPVDVLATMREHASQLSDRGYVLRTGGAVGADEAFLIDHLDGKSSLKELWLPWRGFRHHQSMHLPTEAALVMAAKFHPMWPRLRHAVRLLHARNVHIVLGADLQTPVDFVVCWTQDGKRVGGTGQALRVAEAHGIPIYDLAIRDFDIGAIAPN